MSVWQRKRFAGYKQERQNACLFFYDCISCNGRLKPNPGDCCVFCSYGSVPCALSAASDWCGLVRAVGARKG
ncbi:MAG: GDCCVxC domain-containing (seleno)protein [Chthoniobacterales bacterium]